ncbi:MAG: hypothetical protein ACLP50_01700 [Solirubrobacteraceae bacterium]
MDRIDVDCRRIIVTGWAADWGFAAADAWSRAISRLELCVNDPTVIAAAPPGATRSDVTVHFGRGENPRIRG